jgi:uncharacterized protein YbjT (DUF2867 family)
MFVISGATGHVGSVVAAELLAKKPRIRVIVRSPEKGAAWAKQGAEVAVGSLDDQAFLSGALRGGVEGFFAMSPPPPFTTTDFYAYQRELADAIAAAVGAAGVPHVVMLSSIGADLSSGNGPIRGLNYLENALRATGTTLTAIRACGFQENVGALVGVARTAGIYPNFAPSVDTKEPMIATRDIGTLAAESLLQRPAKGEIVDLQGPAYSANDLADKLGSTLGKRLQVVNVPQAEWVSTLTRAGLPQLFAEVYADMYAGFNSGRIRPVGDRLVQGRTPIDEVIQTVARLPVAAD